MKKVLFATTALVGMAGVAAADTALTITGSAEMGVFGASGGTNLQFHTDVDVGFSGKATTDGGVEFGFSVDLDESADQSINPGPDGIVGTADDSLRANPALDNDADDGGATIYVKGAFGTLTMGDTDGALDWAMKEVALAGGSLRDDETAHAGYNGNAGLDGANDGQVARYDYSFGDFSFAVSADIDDNGAAAPGSGGTSYGVGAKYSFAMSSATVGFGVGYQSGQNRSIWGASIDVGFDSGFMAAVNYSSLTGTAVTNTTHYGVGIAYTWDALTLAANYGNFSRTGAADSNGFGVIANYDLGGGASLRAGYGSGQVTGAATVSTYSFGIAMSF